jgi:hypothetical protein
MRQNIIQKFKIDLLKADKKSLYAVMIDLANGNLEKEELTKFLEVNTKERA